MELFVWGREAGYVHYREAVEAAGGRVRFGREPEEAERCDGLLLPGGGDLEPWRYGQQARFCRDVDPNRDRIELALLERFTAAEKPVLGICRGLQVINVFFGGTLLQEVPGHSGVGGGDRLHRVRTAPGALGGIWPPQMAVNSAHHQAADRLGRGLRAVQWAEDGTVEALCHQTLPVWAVQWHPERLRGRFARAEAADGDRLFQAFLGCFGGLCTGGGTERDLTKPKRC